MDRKIIEGRKTGKGRTARRCRHPTALRIIFALLIGGMAVPLPKQGKAAERLIAAKNSHYQIALELQGSGTDLVTGTYTLKAHNTYYIEIAGGAGKDDSWVMEAGKPGEVRTTTYGGKGGYQCLQVTPEQDLTLMLYAGGEGKWGSVNGTLDAAATGAASPDGQAGGGGGSSSVWIRENDGSRQKILLAAAGGGGGATGGTSYVVGHDGGQGYGTNADTHDRIYTGFAASQGGQNGKTWEGWEISRLNAYWQQVIREDLALYDGGNEYLSGGDRLQSWDSAMSLEDTYARFLLYAGSGIASGGGGGFPAGTCSYYSWAGWLIGREGWEWVESSRRPVTGATGTGGYGYTMNPAIASRQFGVEMTYEAVDGYQDGEGFVRIWEETYTLTLDPNGGIFRNSYNPTAITGTFQEPVVIEDPVRDGYLFAGWDGADSEGDDGNWDPVSREFTFQQRDESWRAEWTPVSYSIIYDLQGGTLPAGQTNPDRFTVESGTITLHNPERDGYLFLGWTGSNGSTPESVVEIPGGSVGNRTYTANWQPLAVIGLTAVPNLTYKVASAVDAANRVFPLAKGGVDLSWRSRDSSLPITDGSYRFQVLYYDDRNTAVKEGGSLTTVTYAFQSGTPGKNYVYDKAAPTAPTGSVVRIRDDQVQVSWKASTDRGTQYAFRVDVGYTVNYLAPWQQVLYQALLDNGRQASDAYEKAVSLDSILDVLSNNTYMYYVYRSAQARSLLASYYMTACNTYIDNDNYYNDYYNRVNYAIGCQAYLWREGAPTSLWNPGIPLADSGICALDGEYESGMYSVASNLTKGSSYTQNTGVSFDFFYGIYDDNPDRQYHTVVPVIQNTGAAILFSDNQYHYAVGQINAAIQYTGYRGGSIQLLCQNLLKGTRAYVMAGMSPAKTALTNNLYNRISKEDTLRSAESMYASGSYQSVSDSQQYSWVRIGLPAGYTTGYLKFRGFLNSFLISRIKLVPDSSAVKADTLAGQGSQKTEYSSNVARTTVTTGVYGYLYLTDTVPDTEIQSWRDGIFTADTSVTIPRTEGSQYLHVAAVDHAGNISGTHTIAVTGPEARETIEYTVHFDGNGATSGTMQDQILRLDEPAALTGNCYVRTGYLFDGWNTAKDGSGISYGDRESVVNLSPGLPNINHTEVTLYAMWKPITYTIRYHANNGTDAYIDQTAVYDQMVRILSASVFAYDKHSLIGWGKETGREDEASAGSVVYIPDQTVGNLTDQAGTVIHLYAVWLDERITITGTVQNKRRPSAQTFRDGEAASLSLIASGWPVEVTVAFPQEWNAYLMQTEGRSYDISYSYEGDSYAAQESYFFSIPMDESCARAGESYCITLQAVNVYGNTDTCDIWLTIDEKGSITEEIRTRLK